MKWRECKEKRFIFGEGEKLILFVGRLDDIKGVDYLIEAFAKVIKRVRTLVC